MQCTVVDFAKDTVSYTITDTNKAELENKLHLFFTSERLPLKSENGEERIYQRGNKIMRVLFGVFVKYFKIKATLRQEGAGYTIQLKRDMSLVLSGGLAGINASRKEFTRINDAFKIYFND